MDSTTDKDARSESFGVLLIPLKIRLYLSQLVIASPSHLLTCFLVCLFFRENRAAAVSKAEVKIG